MHLKYNCLACLYNQAFRAVKVNGFDDEVATKALKESAKIISKLDMNQTPPEAAAIIYPKISKIAKKEDLYREKKIESTKKAKKLIKKVLPKLKKVDIVDEALRLGVAGNVIDFATEYSFDLEKELESVFEAKFAIDDKKLFKDRLKSAKSLMVIGDNVGEHLFDKEMIKIFLDFNPNLKVYYVTRGKPIINDVTKKDALNIGLDKIARVVDSGVDTPGFLLNRENQKTKELFEKVDLVLAKGMGNFECMESIKDDRIFLLFKVKCDVVASKIGKNIGDLICLQGHL